MSVTMSLSRALDERLPELLRAHPHGLSEHALLQALRASGCERTAALAVLGLAEPTDWPAIRRRYRELAGRHHPDRGGEAGRLQEIHAALRILGCCYGGR